MTLTTPITNAGRPGAAAVSSTSLLLDDQLCFSLYAASLALNKVYRSALAPLGLTYPQYLVMLVLWEGDGCSVSDIGERLHLDSATLTPMLKRLQLMGLVDRRRAQDDERRVLVRLTASGRALRQQAKAVPKDVFCATECSPDAARALKTRLDALRASLLRHA